MIRFARALTVTFFLCLLSLLSLPANASPIITFNQPPGPAAGFTFATTVSDYTTPYTASGAGSANALLGAPDGTFDPNTPQYVDFGGGNLNDPWTVTVGFGGTTFGDVPGVDIRIFTTQLNRTEGFNFLASADGVTFVPLGTFLAFEASNQDRGSVDIDLNGTPVPAGAKFLRFVGTTVPVDPFTRGFDFDAVGVQAVSADPRSPVPEPATMVLVASGLAVVVRRRRVLRQK